VSPDLKTCSSHFWITSCLPTIHELAAFVIARAFSGTEAQACFCRIPKKNHAIIPPLVVALPE
jgi:hypothetical protein